jgi:hypothetical protein
MSLGEWFPAFRRKVVKTVLQYVRNHPSDDTERIPEDF